MYFREKERDLFDRKERDAGMRGNMVKTSERRHYQNTVEYSIWLAGLLLGGLALIGAALVLGLSIHPGDVGTECWIHRSGGIYCPGCGGTRAVFALIHGRVLLSAWYHPAVIYAAILYLVYMVRGCITVFSKGRFPFMKWRLGYVYGGIGVIILQFLAKNIMLLGFHLQWMP